MISILIVDDDPNIQKLLSVFLNQRGYGTVCVSNGIKALACMEEQHFDMVIADIMMPRMDGYELTADIRAMDARLPILMITARDAFEDKRRGFLSGIDDYMTKPINPEEMALRIAALLRRAKISAENRIELGNLVIDAESRVVSAPGETLDMPRLEFDLLFKLLSYPGKIFTRRQLMDEVWGMESEADERTVDVHIKRLREKCERFTEFELLTVRGLGYKAERRV